MNNLKPRQMIELAYQHNLSHTEIVYAVAQCARHVLSLTREQDREVCLKAIEAAEKWSREPTEENRKAAATATATAAADADADYAADAAYAAYSAAYTAAYAAAYINNAIFYAVKASSEDEVYRIILQHLPKLQRVVNLKAFW